MKTAARKQQHRQKLASIADSVRDDASGSGCLSAKDCEGIPTALQQGCRRIHATYDAASSSGGGSPVLVNAPDDARNLEREMIPLCVASSSQVPSV